MKEEGTLEFEWDDEKNRYNINTHGISFKAAKLVFKDINAILYEDPKNSITENREGIVGMIHNKLWFVCFTRRNGRIRIISARKANKIERTDYYDNL